MFLLDCWGVLMENEVTYNQILTFAISKSNSDMNNESSQPSLILKKQTKQGSSLL